MVPIQDTSVEAESAASHLVITSITNTVIKQMIH